MQDECEHKRLWIAIGKCRDCGTAFIAQDAEVTVQNAGLTSHAIQITTVAKKVVLQEITLAEIRRTKQQEE